MKVKSKKSDKIFSFPVIFAVAFLIIIIFSSRHGYIDYWLGGVYFPMSLICFLLYTKDKWAAKKNEWRIKESTLQLIALLGGWPGAILAQHWLRHKSSKISFLIIFWLVTLINLLLLSLLLYHQGIIMKFLT